MKVLGEHKRISFLHRPAEEPQRVLQVLHSILTWIHQSEQWEKYTAASLPEKQQHKGNLSDHDKEPKFYWQHGRG